MFVLLIFSSLGMIPRTRLIDTVLKQFLYLVLLYSFTVEELRALKRSLDTTLTKLKRMHQVYFIQQRSTEAPIKIGYTKDIDKRIKSLQTGNGAKLKLLHTITCTSEQAARTVERELHEIFSYGRRGGEWFCQDNPLRMTIAELRKGRFYSDVKQFAWNATQKKWKDRRNGLRIHLKKTNQWTPQLEHELMKMGRPIERTAHWQDPK